jgi:hypothetical protein
VHERCVALLLSGEAGPALAAAAVADDLRARIEALDVPVEVVLDAASPAAYLDHLRVVLQGSRATLVSAARGPAAAVTALLASAGMA